MTQFEQPDLDQASNADLYWLAYTPAPSLTALESLIAVIDARREALIPAAFQSGREFGDEQRHNWLRNNSPEWVALGEARENARTRIETFLRRDDITILYRLFDHSSGSF